MWVAIMRIIKHPVQKVSKGGSQNVGNHRQKFVSCTLRSWVHDIFSHYRTVSLQLEEIYDIMFGKLSEPHFIVLLFSNPGEKV